MSRLVVLLLVIALFALCNAEVAYKDDVDNSVDMQEAEYSVEYDQQDSVGADDRDDSNADDADDQASYIDTGSQSVKKKKGIFDKFKKKIQSVGQAIKTGITKVGQDIKKGVAAFGQKILQKIGGSDPGFVGCTNKESDYIVVDSILAQTAKWVYGDFTLRDPNNGNPLSVGDTIPLQTSKNGCDTVKVVATYSDSQNKHNFAAFIYWEKGSAIILSIRGTKTTKNWVSNLNFPKVADQCNGKCGKIHQGFNGVWNTLNANNRIINDIPRLLQANKASKVFLTGHSLGGAVATIAAARIDDFFTKAGKFPFSRLHLTTFAAPRVGDKGYLSYWEDKCKNTKSGLNFRRYVQFFDQSSTLNKIINTYDVVTTVPMVFLGFVHVGVEIPITCDSRCSKGGIMNILLMHSMQNYIYTALAHAEKNKIPIVLNPQCDMEKRLFLAGPQTAAEKAAEAADLQALESSVVKSSAQPPKVALIEYMSSHPHWDPAMEL